MKKTIEYNGKVNLVRANNSISGNPAYKVMFLFNNQIITGKTANNASFAYTLKSTYGDMIPARVAYHQTASGRVIFDNIELL